MIWYFVFLRIVDQSCSYQNPHTRMKSKDLTYWSRRAQIPMAPNLATKRNEMQGKDNIDLEDVAIDGDCWLICNRIYDKSLLHQRRLPLEPLRVRQRTFL